MYYILTVKHGGGESDTKIDNATDLLNELDERMAGNSFESATIDRIYEASAIDECIEHILQYEGGFVNHPRDPGGATNKGITYKTFKTYYPHLGLSDLKNITDEQVRHIYRDGYWDKVNADSLAPGLNLSVFDMAVNAGPRRAARMFQRSINDFHGYWDKVNADTLAPGLNLNVGTFDELRVDADIGKKTVAASNMIDHEWLARVYRDRRQEFYEGLPHFPTFGRGWTNRVNACFEASIDMMETEDF